MNGVTVINSFAQCHKVVELKPELFIDSWNHFGWKRPQETMKSNLDPITAMLPLNHAPKCHIHTFFEYFQGW